MNRQSRRRFLLGPFEINFLGGGGKGTVFSGGKILRAGQHLTGQQMSLMLRTRQKKESVSGKRPNNKDLIVL